MAEGGGGGGSYMDICCQKWSSYRQVVFALGHRTSFKSSDYLSEGVRALKMFIVKN